MPWTWLFAQLKVEASGNICSIWAGAEAEGQHQLSRIHHAGGFLRMLLNRLAPLPLKQYWLGNDVFIFWQ